MFGGVLLFHPGWVVSSALAGLASGFGMGPGVSLPLLTAVTLFSLVFECPPVVVWWGEVFFGGGVCLVWLIFCVVWLRGFVVVVSFRPVSASSLTHCCGCRSGLLIPWSAGGLIPPGG